MEARRDAEGRGLIEAPPIRGGAFLVVRDQAELDLYVAGALAAVSVVLPADPGGELPRGQLFGALAPLELGP